MATVLVVTAAPVCGAAAVVSEDLVVAETVTAALALRKCLPPIVCPLS
jgi:hypothetical protein